MNLYDEIHQYPPYNEQESRDRNFMLQSIQTFDDVLTRDNKIMHMSVSPWIINVHHDKVLMLYHNLYQSWSWSGGHCDGETDFLAVAIRVAQAETGLIVHPYKDAIFAIDVLTVPAHYKKGAFVSAHMHMNITYLCIGDDSLTPPIIALDHQDVAWFSMDEVLGHVREEHMKPVYQKLIDQVKNLSSDV